jgi:beta-lactamase class A
MRGTKVKDIMRFLIITVICLCHLTAVLAQQEDRKLKTELEKLVTSFKGDVGIYVQHLKTGKTVAINADSIFPTASMIKIPISIGVFNKIESGELRYDSSLTYKDSLLYKGVDILGSFKNDERIELSKVIMLMLTMSDNTASLWCQYLAGTGTTINAWLEQNHFISTRVNSRTPGRETDRELFGWGQTTPREMATLMMMIRQGKVVSPRTSERIYRTLTHNYWDAQSLSQIPPYVQAACKQGSVDQSKSEVVLVNAPGGDYVYCVITKNQQDTRWKSDNEGLVLLRNVSRLLWHYFEPASDWKPAAKSEEWY